jgi:hypothetical protein
MRTAQSALFVGLALVIAVGCGSSSSRNGFDDQEQNSTSDPSDPQLGGPGDPGFGGDASKNLVLDPVTATVIIDTAANPVVPGSVTYKVSKQGKDVTAGATFTLKDPSLGSFAGAKFTSVAALPQGVLGKSSTVTVNAPEGQALGSLTVVALRKTGAQRDFFFVVPYKENPTPKSDVLKFSTNIKQADVAFSMDTTGSMGSSINNLKSALQTTLLSQLQAAIPNVGLAITDFRDFGDSWVAQVRQPITTNLTLAQNAVGAMNAGGGGDTPEASIASMQYILDGKANNGIPAHANTVPGTFGAVDFRGGSVPVVVNITDADWHDPSGVASMSSLKAAFAAAKAKFVGITETGLGGQENQANDLSDATGSNVPPTEGCPAAPAKDSDGDGIKDTFIAVKAGTPVCFEVIAAMNTTVPAALDPQFFNAFIDVMGLPGDLKLDTRSVLFLVPPTVTGVK